MVEAVAVVVAVVLESDADDMSPHLAFVLVVDVDTAVEKVDIWAG